jgi:hypothetical protein
VRLDAWLAQATESGIAELQSSASGREKDKDAVKAGLTWSINTGMVEGHVTKLKLIKMRSSPLFDFATSITLGVCRLLVCNTEQDVPPGCVLLVQSKRALCPKYLAMSHRIL